MIETNKDRLVKAAVMGEVNTPWANETYSTAFDGSPRIGSGLRLGMNGLKYNIKIGDPCIGWVEGEHVEPGVSVANSDSAQNNALALLACVGNEATVKSGDAKGAKGVITGKHGPFHVHFSRSDKENISIGDKVQFKAWGVGLRIKGYEDVNIHKCDPELLENMGIEVNNGKLVVPVVAEFPAEIMGSGYGMSPHSVDYDIQSTCPDVIDELGINRLHLGDFVALHDQLNDYGRGYYKGAVSVGVVIHGWSHHPGHGPGVTTLISARPGRVMTKIDSKANIVNVLRLILD
jgi:hypothetical protein